MGHWWTNTTSLLWAPPHYHWAPLPYCQVYPSTLFSFHVSRIGDLMTFKDSTWKKYQGLAASKLTTVMLPLENYCSSEWRNALSAAGNLRLYEWRAACVSVPAQEKSNTMFQKKERWHDTWMQRIHHKPFGTLTRIKFTTNHPSFQNPRPSWVLHTLVTMSWNDLQHVRWSKWRSEI